MKLAPPTPLLVINLEKSVDRRARMEEQLSRHENFNWSFVKAVDGRLLPDSAAFSLCENTHWSKTSKGTIGCFLSHVKCWELVRNSGAPYSIILEDDSVLLALDQLYTLDIPEDTDILYINERMSLPITDSHHTCYPVTRGIIGHSQQSRFWGPGTDGYLLAADGAAKLLRAIQVDKFYGNTDGRVLRYCTNEADAKNLPEGSKIKRIILENHSRSPVPQMNLLNGYVVSPPLVQAGGFPSVRE